MPSSRRLGVRFLLWTVNVYVTGQFTSTKWAVFSRPSASNKFKVPSQKMTFRLGLRCNSEGRESLQLFDSCNAIWRSRAINFTSDRPF
jgi:hypothetical protein